jgi:DNA-binding SARP family transcriptional activator
LRVAKIFRRLLVCPFHYVLGVTRLSLALSGGFELNRGNGSAPIELATRKAEALFAYLVLNGSAVRRDTLCALLWGEVPSVQARHSLRQALSGIRTALRPRDDQFIQTTRDRVAISPRAVRVDILLIERLVRRGSTRALGLACTLCRGELLAGVEIREAEFERWLVTERAQAKQLAIEAHERYVDRLIGSGDYPMATQSALRLVALDPLHERAHRTLMTLYAAQGRMTAALQQYDLCAAVLARELGVEPAPETQRIRRDLATLRTRFVQTMRSEAADSPRRPKGAKPHQR